MFKVMSCHVIYLDSRVKIMCFPCQDTVCCNGQLEIQEMKSSNSLDDATEKWGWLQPWRPVVTSTKSGLALAMYSPACSWTGKHVWFQKVLKHHEWNITIYLDLWLIFDWSLTILGSLMYFSQSSLNRLVLKHSGIAKGCWGSLGDTSRKNAAANPFIAPASVNFTMPSLRIPSPQCPPPMVKSCWWDERYFKTNKTRANSSAIKWPRSPRITVSVIHLKRQHGKWCEHANTGKTFHKSSTADLHCFSQTSYTVSPHNDIVMVSGVIWDQEVVQCVPTCVDTVALQSCEKK